MCSFSPSKKIIEIAKNNHRRFSIMANARIMKGRARDDGENSNKRLLTAGLYKSNNQKPNTELNAKQLFLSVLSFNHQ